jgi:hypothetical protein
MNCSPCNNARACCGETPSSRLEAELSRSGASNSDMKGGGNVRFQNE